jgi:hypothetical protein
MHNLIIGGLLFSETAQPPTKKPKWDKSHLVDNKKRYKPSNKLPGVYNIAKVINANNKWCV